MMVVVMVVITGVTPNRPRRTLAFKYGTHLKCKYFLQSWSLSHVRHATFLSQTPSNDVLLNNGCLTFRWRCIMIISYDKTNYMHWFLKFIFGIKLYMFRTVSLSIIRKFSLYTQQWCMSYRSADVYHCCVYSEKLLMMDRGTVRNM